MLRLATTLFFLSAVSLNCVAQQNVRVIQTSGNGNTRQINNTNVPVIEKKVQHKMSPNSSSNKNDNRKTIKPASYNKSQMRNQSQKSK
ncbi:MAG: hypothetical protein IPJ79_00925 [Bacteroidetes bacterium]|nr:hypothetical protein [Bacteroidota bacterium]